MKRITGVLAIFVVLCALFVLHAFAEPSRCPYSLWNQSIHYRNMSAAQRKFFDDMYDAVRDQKEWVPIEKLTTDEAYLIADTLFNECAELCSLGKWIVWGHDINGVWTPTKMHLEYKRSLSEQENFINYARTLSRRFTSVNDVYVYLCENLKYGDSSKHPEQAYAYESLKGGLAVCNGYAQSMAMLCHFAGLECSYIDGGTKNGGRHAWNIVRINGKYTLVDCTWDDKGSGAAYRWFALSDREMGQSHTPDPEYKVLPACVNLQGSTAIASWRTAAFNYNNLAFTLKLNDKGDAVVKINKRLIELGYMSGSPNHAYNNDTKKAVAAFQSKNGIHGNSASMGVCTHLTQAALFGDSARKKNEDAPSVQSTISSSPFTVYIGKNYGVKRSGNKATLTFTLKNNNTSQPITAFTLRYWADDSRGKLVYIAREQLLTSVNLAPGEMREFTINVAEDTNMSKAALFKWNITEVAYENGEIFIGENLSGKDAYCIATYNENVR